MPTPDRRPRMVTFIVAIAVLIAAPMAVVASENFTDVSDSNVHSADIDWLADNGVTLGCNPPDNDEFCPEDAVLRQQMASFMRRLAENQIVDAATAVQADNATNADSAASADSLGGLAPEDLQTLAVTQSLADESSVTMVQFPAYTAVMTMDVTTPSDRGVVLDYGLSALTAGTGDAFRFGISPGPDCSAIDVNTHVYGSVLDNPAAPGAYDSASGTLAVSQPEGTSQYTLCAQSGGLAELVIVGASMTAEVVGGGEALPVLGTNSSAPPSGFGN